MFQNLLDVTNRFVSSFVPMMAASSAAMPSTAPWADYWYQSVGLPGSSNIIGGDEAYELVAVMGNATTFLSGVGSTIPINLTKTIKKPSGMLWNIVDDDPRQKLLNAESNSDQVAMSFRSMLCAWQINRGTGFAEIVRESYGRNGEPGMPTALWPIYPNRCRPIRSMEDDSLWWRVQNHDGSHTDIPDMNMFRVPYILMAKNGLMGIGNADRAFQQIQLGQNMDRTENDASMSGVPRIVVEAPQRMTIPEQDAFRRQWKEIYTQGGGDAVALLVGGMKATPLSWSATASDFDARRARFYLTCASLYGVPPILLQLLDDPSADPAKLLQMFQKCGLKWLTMWVQEANKKLLTESERQSGLGWKLDYQSLLEADPAGRADYYSRLFPLATFSPNMILQAEGLNPYPEGDKRFVQGAMRPIDEPYSATSPQNPPVDPTTGKRDPLKSPKAPKALALKVGARTMLEDCVRRLTHKEALAAQRAAKKPNEWMAWVDSFYADHSVWAASELKLPLEVCAVFGMKADATGLAQSLAEASKTELINAADGDRNTFGERVESLTAAWERDRAAAFVRTIAELN